MIKCRSVTPDEYKMGRLKLKLLYAYHQTLFGKCLIVVTSVDKDVVHLVFVEDGDEISALQVLRNQWSLSEISEDTEHVTEDIIEKVFLSDAPPLDSFHVLLKGTNFQTKVWEYLTTIPIGTTQTYEEVAEMMGNRKAVRAVANAISKNHIAYIVPCHRVRGKNGSMKYAWGIERKKAILQHESVKGNEK